MKTVIFDLDGTLLDTLADLTLSTNLALADFKMPQRTAAEVRRFLGHGIARLIARSVPAETPPDLEAQVLDRFRDYYGAHCLDETAPYPGVTDLLQTLRAAGVKTALVSNKADFAVRRIVERFFPGSLDFAIGEQPPYAKKPAPDMVFAAMDRLGAAPGETVYIGDSEVDFLTGRSAGLPVILVDWGFRDREELLPLGSPVVSEPGQIAELLRLTEGGGTHA